MKKESQVKEEKKDEKKEALAAQAVKESGNGVLSLELRWGPDLVSWRDVGTRFAAGRT